jgi:hypothetical protein
MKAIKILILAGLGGLAACEAELPEPSACIYSYEDYPYDNPGFHDWEVIDLKSDLAVYYPFFDNADDWGQYGHHGQIYDSASAPLINGEAFFDGNDYIRVPNLRLGERYSICIDFSEPIKDSLQPLQEAYTILSKHDASGNGWSLAYIHCPDVPLDPNYYTLTFTVRNGGQETARCLDSWGSSQLFIVLRCNSEGFAFSSIDHYNRDWWDIPVLDLGEASDMIIGGEDPRLPSAAGRYYRGSIRAIRIYNRAISDAETFHMFYMYDPLRNSCF